MSRARAFWSDSSGASASEFALVLPLMLIFLLGIMDTGFYAWQINRAEKATQIMLHVHTRGRGVCGVYTREVAESKVAQVNEYSRLNQHPLLCTMEKA